MPERDQMINRIVNAYLGSVTGARGAYMSDASYHERLAFMVRLLEIFDLAMEQEDLITRTRFKILERVMLSAPDPAESKRQLEILKNLTINLNHWDPWLKEQT